MDRITTFKNFVSQRPEDPFPLYGLAMEYKNLGDNAEAEAWFQQLLEKFPEYVPGYFHAGQNLAASGRPQDAAACFRRGIEVCEKAGDGKTKDELQAALADLDSGS